MEVWRGSRVMDFPSTTTAATSTGSVLGKDQLCTEAVGLDILCGEISGLLGPSLYQSGVWDIL